MTARDTFIASVASAHTSATSGGVGNLPGVPTPTGNIVSWSRQSASTACNNGAITQAQYNTIMTALNGWEEEQVSLAKSVLRASGDAAPA